MLELIKFETGGNGSSSIFFEDYFFLALLGLHCCVQAFSSCSEQGLLFVAVKGRLIVVASLVESTGSRHTSFSSGSTLAQ